MLNQPSSRFWQQQPWVFSRHELNQWKWSSVPERASNERNSFKALESCGFPPTITNSDSQFWLGQPVPENHLIQKIRLSLAGARKWLSSSEVALLHKNNFQALMDMSKATNKTMKLQLPRCSPSLPRRFQQHPPLPHWPRPVTCSTGESITNLSTNWKWREFVEALGTHRRDAGLNRKLSCS